METLQSVERKLCSYCIGLTPDVQGESEKSITIRVMSNVKLVLCFGEVITGNIPLSNQFSYKF